MRKAIFGGMLGVAALAFALATPAKSEAHDRGYSFSFSAGPVHGHYHGGHRHHGHYHDGYHRQHQGFYHRPYHGGSLYYSRPSYYYSSPYQGGYRSYDYYTPRSRYYYDPYCR